MTKEQSFKFPVPREIVLNANQSVNFRVKGLIAKALRDMGESLGNATKEHEFTKYVVDVYVYPPSKRRIDPPNLYPTVKHLVDGLTDAQVWKDDDWEHMEYMTFRYGGLSQMKEMFVIELKVKGEVA